MNSFYIPNILYIPHNFLVIIKNSSKKINKRFSRFLLGYEVLLSLRPHDAEKIYKKFSNCQIISCDNNKIKPGKSISNFCNIVSFKRKENVCDDIVGSLLTKYLNKSMFVYMLSLKWFYDICKILEKDRKYKKYLAEKRILPLLKGSTIEAFVLWQNNVDINKIKECYSPSDNDTTFLIDPELPQSEFDYISNLIEVVCKQYLRKQVKKIMFFDSAKLNNLIVELNKINQDKVIFDKLTENGIKSTQITPALRPNIVIDDCGNNYIKLTKKIEDGISFIYFSENKNVSFASFDNKKKYNFKLFRIKASYKIGNVCYGAEILDISIPKQNDSTLKKFDKYKTMIKPISYSQLCKEIKLFSNLFRCT
jgi:hypothetical protein